MTKVVLAGGTGLIGGAVAPILVLSGAELRTIGRRQSNDHMTGIIAMVADPGQWRGCILDAASDVAINCLGTTLKVAGSRDAFRAVDHDLVLAYADAAKAAGARQFITVSSVGASASSSNFYLRTKGEVEEALRAIGFARLDIVRPGLLTGRRGGQRRIAESLAALVAPATDMVLHGPFRRYRSVPATTVAGAIVGLVGKEPDGTFIHEHDAIARFAD